MTDLIERGNVLESVAYRDGLRDSITDFASEKQHLINVADASYNMGWDAFKDQFLVAKAMEPDFDPVAWVSGGKS